MESNTQIENFYTAVLKDCYSVFTRYKNKKDGSINQEKEEVKQQTQKIDTENAEEKKSIQDSNDSVDILCDNCQKILKEIHIPKNNYFYIYSSFKEYIDNICTVLKGVEISKDFGVTEHDIYFAYGYLSGISIVLEEIDLDAISKFNYVEYDNLSNFLITYGNTNKLKNNYQFNFEEYKGEKKLNIKMVNTWIDKLKNKELSPMEKNSNSLKKKKKRNKGKKRKIDSTPQTNKYQEEIKTMNANKEKMNEETINNENNGAKDIFVGQEKNKVERDESKEKKNSNKKESKAHNDEIKTFKRNNDKIKIAKDKDYEITQNNNDTLYKKEGFGNNNFVFKNTIKTNETELTFTPQQNDLLTYEKKLIELEKRIKESMNNKINELEKEIAENNDKNDKNEKQIEALNQKVKKLEINQLLLYNQINLYQNSRDIFKSISYYFYEYLNLRGVCPNIFEKIKLIIKYLEEKDDNKLKQMQNDNTKLIEDEFRPKLAKYFKLHFFVNKVSNKIIHRNFSEEQRRLLKENKDADLLPLIPDYDFEECFNSLKFYVENSIKDKQIQNAMQIVYKDKYRNDGDLGQIFDSEGDVIKLDENGVRLIFNGDDIEQIKKYFNGLKINDELFINLCNEKIWDKEK